MKFEQKHYFKAVSILCLLVLAGGVMSIAHAQADETAQTDHSLWRSIKQRAEKAGERKALWRELKKLEPKQLLKAGEQFCQQEPVEQDPFSHVMTVNAILSYHQDKTSYHETARVVSHIVRNSNNVPWIYGALKWPVINEHWRMIPEHIDDIGLAMAQRLEDNQAPQKLHLLVSNLCTEDEFYMNWSEDTLKRIYGAMKKRQNALKEQGENAKSTRSRLKKCIAQLKPLVESDRFKRVDVQLNASGRLWPDAVTCLAKALFRYGQQSRDMRGQAVDILAKLKGRNSVPEACKILFKEYEKEPNEEIRNKMVKALKTIDPELKETNKQAEMHSWVKSKKLWERLSRD